MTVVLTVLGTVLSVAAIIAVFLNKPWESVVALLLTGGVMVLVAVFGRRLHGKQKFKVTGIAAEFNLAKIAKGERDFEAGRFTRLEEIE